MYHDAINSWKFHHPDWQYYLWTDQTILNFVEEFFPDFLSLFQKYSEQIQRVDMVRYMLLYQYGGIYSDLDIACNQNLSFFLDHEIVLPETGYYFKKFYYSNDLMYGRPAHPFFKFVLDGALTAYRLYNWKFIPHHFRILLTTGSLFLSSRYRLYESKNEIYILNPDLYGKDLEKRCVTHLPGNSWCKRDTYFFLFLEQQLEKIKKKIWVRVKS